jgi:ribosome-binding protein aMBF1 (putative translation factor)
MSFEHQDWNPVTIRKDTPNKKTVLKQTVQKPSATGGNAVKKIYDPENPDAEPEIKPILIEREYAQRIQAYRVALGMNQEQFANAVGIQKSIIVQYENGKGIKNSQYVSKINNFMSRHKQKLN